MDPREDDDFAPPSRRTRRQHANELHDSGLMSDKSSFRGASTAASQPEMASGLNLSFGFTPMQFEKLDLRGNHKPGPGREGMGLSEHAIESLVLSVDNITHLDLRGNRLNAAFGWKLIKAMKKKYLNLEFCNGIPLRALRMNSIEVLDLSPCASHIGMPWQEDSKEAAMEFANRGMYGIEVVGAIFLAHFLRLNTSLTTFNFRLNHVEKDGAKALAQSLLGNAQTVLQTVNTMGPTKMKPGIDFGDFKTGHLTTVDLSKRGLDDDDFVFLEEWLRRYDCVTDLNISWNFMSRDGIRKLTRHIKESKVLTKLNCVGLPVTLEGSALLARAVVENHTLRQVALPLGHCHDTTERQQMIQQFGMGLASHPTLQSFACTRTPNLEYAGLNDVRENKIRAFPPERSGGWPRTQMAVYMWFLAATKPDLERLTLGGNGKPKVEYPKEVCQGANPDLIPATLGVLHDAGHRLQQVSLALPLHYAARSMELMRVLTVCVNMRTLKILGFASATLKESQLPPEWNGLGNAPRWLFDDRLQKKRTHWQTLHGLLNALPHLEQFNDLALGSPSMRESPELTSLLLMQCLEGVATDLANGAGGGEALLKANLQGDADVDAFCDILRLLSRTPLLIDLNFSDKRMETVKAQQAKLIPHLSGHGDGVPRFTHAISLRNNVVSEALLQGVDCHAPIREFGFENISAVLPSLFTAMCGREKPLPVERIRVEPKWVTSRFARKRFKKRPQSWLDGIQAAMIRSDRFVEIVSAGTSIPRSDIERMSPKDFADALTGVALEEPFPVEAEKLHPPHMQYLCFPSRRAYQNPPEDVTQNLYVPLPLDDETRNELQLQKLSFVMCNLRQQLQLQARPDEWPDSSKPLWCGKGSELRFVRPGDEMDAAMEAQHHDDETAPVRFHWQKDLRLGSPAACAMIAEDLLPNEPSFAENFLHEALRSLLHEESPIQDLDLRGNGLTRDDVNLLLDLVSSHKSLVRLNQIPVLEEEAATCPTLVIDGTGLQEPAKQDDGYDDEEDPADEAYAKEVFQHEVVRMDEGDGYIFLQLVAPNSFPELREVTLKKLEIPHDSTLAHITDALLQLRSVEVLRLSHLRLTSRGASLLLQAVAELAPRLTSLNGLPLARLVQLKDHPEGGPLDLGDSIEWNDFTLGVMARLNLWQAVSFAGAGGVPKELKLHGQSFTDVGLRGLCAMLRHFAGQGVTRSSAPLNLTKIDLSGNLQITDATVADLCHTLKTPHMGTALRGLRELNLRSCMRLKTRSAYELLNFIQHVREASRDPGAGQTLRMVNGVDLEALQAASRGDRAAAVGRPTTAPPILLRNFLEPKMGTAKAAAASMTECDVHFFAGVMHHYQNIPYCHVHIVIPTSLLKEDASTPLDVWGRPPHQASLPCSNDSPFPPPVSGGRLQAVAAQLQAQVDATCRLFEACPALAELRISMIPAVPGCEEILRKAGHDVLVTSTGTGSASAMDCFSHSKQRLQEKAAKKRKAKQIQGAPAKALYVNNINRQRLHCCFRTLYGKDDAELAHEDIMTPDLATISLPSDVDVSNFFSVATSVDLQHLDLSPSHISKLPELTEMPALTHVNLNYNHLGDVGVELLFRAMVDAGSSIEHLAVSSNDIGDEGAAIIGASLGSLPRLTSLELCDNFIQERGSIAIAEAIAGATPPEEDGDEAVASVPLPILSVDLKGNRSRELGARRWAEVICHHPDLKFLNLAQNELGCLTKEIFLDLVCGAVASASLSVLDLQDNFPRGGFGTSEMGPPPPEVIEELLAELPAGEYDPAEVRKGVFIRRHRGSTEKKGH